MRNLEKLDTPPVLVAHGAEWTEEYRLSILTSSQVPARWRHPEIVDTLRNETFQKCAYCEGIIYDVSYGHVEHMRPRAHRPDLVVTWSNLTMSCQTCNTNKGDYYDEAAPIGNPYEHVIEDHILFRRPMIACKPGSTLGERTITKLDLRRGALFVERAKRVEALHRLIDLWASTAGPDKAVYETLVEKALSDDQEFVACLREYAQSVGFTP